jgi:hypothetical protein
METSSSLAAGSQESDQAPLALSEAFDALVRVVSRLRTMGKSHRAASVKPDLRVETAYRFDERALGFPSFRAFLVAAEQANRIVLRPAPSGPDVDVYLAGEQAPLAPRPIDTLHYPEIRPDLWKNFVDWSPGWIRLYDRETGTAIRFPDKEIVGDDPDYDRLRALFRSQPDRFVPITPIDVRTTLDWMQQFARSFPDGPTRSVLEAGLLEPRPLREFTQAVRQRDLYGEWNLFRSDRLRTVILDWAAQHALDIDLDATSATEGIGAAFRKAASEEGPTPAAAPGHPPLPASAAVEELRGWAHRIIDRMDAAQLLRLPATLEQLLQE